MSCICWTAHACMLRSHLEHFHDERVRMHMPPTSAPHGSVLASCCAMHTETACHCWWQAAFTRRRIKGVHPARQRPCTAAQCTCLGGACSCSDKQQPMQRKPVACKPCLHAMMGYALVHTAWAMIVVCSHPRHIKSQHFPCNHLPAHFPSMTPCLLLSCCHCMHASMLLPERCACRNEALAIPHAKQFHVQAHKLP